MASTQDKCSSSGGGGNIDDVGDDHNDEDENRTSDDDDDKTTSTTNMKSLAAMAALLEDQVQVKVRRYRLKRYSNAFVGSDAVTVLHRHLQQVDTRYTRQQAERLGRHLARRFDLLRHVLDEHELCDDYLFYRFVPKGRRRRLTGGGSSDGGSGDADAGEDEDALYLDRLLLDNDGCTGRHYRQSLEFDEFKALGMLTEGLVGTTVIHDDDSGQFSKSSSSSSREGSSDELGSSSGSDHGSRQLGRGDQGVVGLLDAAVAFENGVEVKTHRHRGRSFPKTFVGTDAVDFLVAGGYGRSRKEACKVGQALMDEYNLFALVFSPRSSSLSVNEATFQDDYLFYAFTEKDKRIDDASTDSSWQESFSSIGDLGTVSLEEIANRMRLSVKVADRKHRLKAYKQCFIGREAVSFLVAARYARTRRGGVSLGRQLARDLDLFHHVVDPNKELEDGYFFFRFSGAEPPTIATNMKDASFKLPAKIRKPMTHSPAGSETKSSSKPPAEIETIAEAMRLNIKVKKRRYYHRVYRACFLGSDAVTFLVEAGYATDRNKAVQLAREVNASEKVFEHVEQDHDLKDSRLFYRFVPTPLPVAQSLHSLRSLADKFEGGIPTHAHRYRLRIYNDTFVADEAVLFMFNAGLAANHDEAVELLSAMQTNFRLFEHVSREHIFKRGFLFFRFVPPSERINWTDVEIEASWNKKLSDFSERASNRRIDGKGLLALSPARPSDLDELQASRYRIWLFEFKRLDPRWRILNYFTEVAQLGAEGRNLQDLHPLLWFLSRSSVFTVWRPTRFEAIRRMMRGEAVGKGLNIKGKSANKGKLEGLVPFLQIGTNQHKAFVRTIRKDGRIRLFFGKDSFYARDEAVAYLEACAQEMLGAVALSRETLQDEGTDDKSRDREKEKLLWEMDDTTIEYLDDYSPCCYGIECPARLLWEAYVIRQDCYRQPGSQYDCGRPSTPAFQDLNLAALQHHQEDSPRAVLWQNAAPDDPLNVQELLMAYEENGRVLPVVSDFDPFLVATRRVHYDPVEGALPPEQLGVLRWSIDCIEKILDAPMRPESWTNRWLEVLMHENKSGFHPQVPRYGFADPKSYSIIQNAVERLTQDGAVRHGAESFNYYFPQEIDDHFLVIFDGFGAVPWRYMNEGELLHFLGDRVDDGFSFPLNPKWVLCDGPGWKDLYDRLIASDKEDIVNSMNVWFPELLEIRKRIEEIAAKHPEGFIRGMRQ